MTFSEEWEKRYAEEKHLSVWPWSDVVSLVMRYCKNDFNSNYKVLELGCGAGANIPLFLNNNVQYHGIEGSETIVKKICDLYPSLNNNIITGDFTTSIEFDCKFDLIIDRASVTCNSSDSIINTIKLIKNHMKENAKFIGVDWYSIENSEYQLGESLENDEHTKVFIERGEFAGTGPVHFFDESSLKEILSDFNILYLEHKEHKNIVPLGNDYKFSSWNFVVDLNHE